MMQSWGCKELDTTEQLNTIKLKSFCTAKEIIDKMKRQATEWEKIFGNGMTNMTLISNIYK